MKKDEVFAAIDFIRESGYRDDLILGRIANYMEANVDEFIECYEDVDND